mgnify:FL=1
MKHFIRFLTLTILLTLAGCGPAVATDPPPTTNPAIIEPSSATAEPILPSVPTGTSIPPTSQPSPTLPVDPGGTNWLYQIAFAASTGSSYDDCAPST